MTERKVSAAFWHCCMRLRRFAGFVAARTLESKTIEDSIRIVGS